MRRRGIKANSARRVGHTGRQQSNAGIDNQGDTPPGVTSISTLQESQASGVSSSCWNTLGPVWSDSDEKDERVVPNSWKAFAIASDRTIQNLVRVFFEIVYPM